MPSFKAHFSRQWEEYQLEFTSQDTSQDVTKKAGNFIPPTQECKVRWVSKSWDQVTAETVQKGFNFFRPDQEEPEAAENEVLENDMEEKPQIVTSRYKQIELGMGTKRNEREENSDVSFNSENLNQELNQPGILEYDILLEDECTYSLDFYLP